ncbi:MAG: hypothetical protein ACRDTE_23805, partial [Pseudonocardiaceae bacterium]
ALWWAYFDVTALIAERALAAADGARQIRLARGGYSFLHLPMVHRGDHDVLVSSLARERVGRAVAEGKRARPRILLTCSPFRLTVIPGLLE